jgi:hypothetical protein
MEQREPTPWIIGHQSKRSICGAVFCNRCGKKIHNPSRATKYCSDECRDVVAKEKKQKSSLYKCVRCGVEYNQKAKEKYCSHECRYSKFKHSDRIIDCKHCGKKIHGPARGTKFCSLVCKKFYALANPTPRPRICEGCGVHYNASHCKQQYCSNPCRHKWARKKAMGENQCKTCHNRFTPTPDTYMDYCSHDCKRAAKRADWIKNNTKRQSIVCAIPMSERVNTEEIFIRDNYTCQICGIKTSREGGRYSADYPTMDHIFPISRGGAHVASNLRCACRRCNVSKGCRVVA